MNAKERTIRVLKNKTCSTCINGFKRPSNWHCSLDSSFFDSMHTCNKWEIPLPGSIKRFMIEKNDTTWQEWNGTNWNKI